MADNLIAKANTGTGTEVLAAKDIGGVLFPRTIITDLSGVDVGSANPLPVALDASSLAALDRALFGLEDSLRKARTPRVRRKKLASAAQYAEAASAIIATIPMAAQPLDLSPIREALALIISRQSAFQDWRTELIQQAHNARLELQVMQVMQEEEEAAMFMLLAA